MPLDRALFHVGSTPWTLSAGDLRRARRAGDYLVFWGARAMLTTRSSGFGLLIGAAPAFAALLLAASCASRAREEPRAAAPNEGAPATSKPAPHVELVPAVTCSASAAAGDSHERPSCSTRQTVLVDLDHDGARDCVRWTRCEPDEPSALGDGGFAYPRDRIEATGADGGGAWTLYDNEPTRQAERVEELAVLGIGGIEERLLVRVVGYGSGNVQLWSILDVSAGAPRRWTEPPMQDAFARLLTPPERIGKQYGRAIEVKAGRLEVGWLVYRPGDPGCCPSGGVMKAELVPAGDGLRIRRVWREPLR